MRKVCELMLVLGCGLWLGGRAVAREPWPVLSLAADDRILVLAPHPDDEVIGCAGLIQRAVAQQLPVRVVWLTYGDNNEWSFLLYRKRPVVLPGGVRKMGQVRRGEAVAAAEVLGVTGERLTFLGYPDFRCLRIWHTGWGDQPAIRALLTRARAVPYSNAYRPGAPYKGEEVVADLVAILREFRPTKIFVSHPADDNGDHRALYLFTRVALWELGGEMQPAVLPYLAHFGRWPQPRGLAADRPLEPPAMLATELPWRSLPVAGSLVARKVTALRTHRSQYRYSRKYLLSFVRPNELFGDFPDLTLRGEASTELLDKPAAAIDEVSEELTDSERAQFVGVDREIVRREGDRLVVTVHLNRALDRDVEASVYVFGYRSDRPFGTMPKLHVRVGQSGYACFDQGRRLRRNTVAFERTLRSLTVRIPLAQLGNPQRLLTSARTYRGEVPLDWLAWRVLNLDDAA